MTWKTALSKHTAAVVNMAPLTHALFNTRANGLVPDSMLQSALSNVYKNNKIQISEPLMKPPGWEKAMLQYFNLRTRMVASKIREVAFAPSIWQASTKKVSQAELAKLEALCLRLNPKFTTSAAEDTLLQGALALQPKKTQQEDHESAASSQLVQTPEPRCSTKRQAEQNEEDDFQDRATLWALQAAWQASPEKPMSNKEKLSLVEKGRQSAPAAQKKPACAEKTRLKKPACADLPDTDWFKQNVAQVQEAVRQSLSIKPTDFRNTFTSKGYAIGKRMAKDRQASSAQMLLWAKAALAESSKMWDEAKV